MEPEYAPHQEDPTYDGEGMSVEKRRLLFIAAVVLLAIFIFAWNIFLNFGKLVIKAPPPFSILIFNDKQYECKENPCVLKLKRGEKNLSFFKPGYKTEGKTIEVPLWHSVEISPIFELEPYVQKIEKIEEQPFITTNIQYKIEYDKTHHNWKLFKEDDPSRRGLSYFPSKLDNPLIFGSNSAVLIVERNSAAATKAIYFIDLKTNERKTIFTPGSTDQSNEKITAAKPSLNGEYFLVKTEGETNSLAIADKENLTFLKSRESFSTSFWTPFNKLVIVEKTSGEKEYAIYLRDPKNSSTKTLISSIKLEENLSGVSVSPSSKKVYIESSSAKYQVVY